MTLTALILGSSGRFGRHMSEALNRHGWTVRKFDRNHDTLSEAVIGADLIVNAWNPLYSEWAAQVPDLTHKVIAAAKASGARVMIPGNNYVYGEDLPQVLSPDTPHRATHPLGQIRRKMEAAYRDAGVKTVILRAGDYIVTEKNRTWFSMIIAAKIGQGKLSYPGPLDFPHAWAYLPDVAEAGARLVTDMESLPVFCEFTFDGVTLTGSELAQALERATGQPMRIKRMAWLPMYVARPFWKEAKHLLEMRYLWQRPHRVDGSTLAAQVPGLRRTPLDEALRMAVRPLA